MYLKNLLFVSVLFASIKASIAQYGILDNSFGTNGMVTIDVNSNSNDVMKSIAVQPDGKILMGGYTSDGVTDKFCLIRLNANGSRDNNFGSNGIVITSFTSSGIASDIAIQTDGKIILAGHTWTGTQNEFTLARYLSDGTLDPAFGNAGLVAAPIENYSASATSLKIQPDGKIIAGGSVINSPADGSSFAMIRYLSNGNPDNSFGTNGIVTTDIALGSGLAALDGLKDLEILQDGKIVAAGFSGPNAVLVKYNGDGSLNTGFGSNGIKIQNFSTNGNSFFNDLDVLENGKIIAAGAYTSTHDLNTFLVVMFNENGSVDNGFGNSGILSSPMGAEQIATATSVLIQGDGKILVGGCVKDPVFQFALIRFDIQGNMDVTFGTNGVTKTIINPDFNQLESMALQADGNILAVGYAGNSTSDVAVARYTSATLSVKENPSLFESISVYPNPVTDDLHIIYSLNNEGNVSIELLNIQGQLIHRTEKGKLNSKTPNEETLQLSDLPVGIYYISIGASDSRQTYKIVKQ